MNVISDFEVRAGYGGYAALSPGGRRIGLLILSEMFGVSPAMQDAARDFAALGISTLVPNIFRRSTHTGVLSYEGSDRDLAQNRADNLDVDAVIEDIGFAIEALRTRVPSLEAVAAVGHCIGGGFAVKALGRTELVAAISYYGFGIASLGQALTDLDQPTQLHYGLADPLIPPGELDAVKRLSASNPKVAVFEYPKAGHSFCNPYRPMYDPPQAQFVRERTLRLLNRLAD